MGAKRDGVVITDYCRTNSSGVALRVRRGKKWVEQNRERFNGYVRKYAKTPKGAAMYRAAKARRRARKLAATVPLTPAEHLRINALYAEAARRTAETGIVHHVDHDKPLALGGLHHPDNLLVVPASINLAKGARYASTFDFIAS